jgi:hypothetical protein
LSQAWPPVNAIRYPIGSVIRNIWHSDAQIPTFAFLEFIFVTQMMDGI